MMFFTLLFAIALSGLGYFAYVGYQRRKLASRSWGDVLGNLEPVDLDGLRRIADSFLQPDKNQLGIEPAEMWKIVGGLEGLNRLKTNAWAMLHLAVFAERWNCEQGIIVSEMIRRDAVRLNRAIIRIQLGVLFQFGFVRSPFYLQEAVAFYYLIRSRLVGLYQISHVGLIPCLEKAL